MPTQIDRKSNSHGRWTRMWRGLRLAVTPTETAAGPPISQDLWARLRRFDATCEIVFVRQRPLNTSAWAGRPRAWIVSIRPYERVSFEMVQREHPTLSEALGQAVDEAERRGWGT